MSGHVACYCGTGPRGARGPKDHADLAVLVRNGNNSVFNGGRWTPSDYSLVKCLRGSCPGMWRSKSKYVDLLPDMTWAQVEVARKNYRRPKKEN